MAMITSGCGPGVVLLCPQSGDEILEFVSLALCLLVAGPVIWHRGRRDPFLDTLGEQLHHYGIIKSL